MGYRAVESKYASGYPPGEIAIGIYTKDADTLSGWVTKHSGPPSSSDPNRYWTPVMNQSTVTISGRSGLSFDWVSDDGGITNHSVVVFLGTTYVLLVGWWSNDSSYVVTLQQDAQRMLNDLKT